MATYKGVAAACDAVIQLLRSSYRTEDFGGHELEFKVYAAQDFTSPMLAGVSLFLYRIVQNGTHRTPPGPVGADGKRQRTLLPVELHFLLTAWGRQPSLQNSIAGWAMRVLEDTPILPSGLLNATYPNVYRPHETVEIVLGELSTEDLFRLWEQLSGQGYQLSVPYVARIIRIESLQQAEESRPVLERRIGG